MKREHIMEFVEKKVVVTDIDGKKFRGVITNTESEFDTSSGKEEIVMDTGTIYVDIPLDEIKDIIEIK